MGYTPSYAKWFEADGSNYETRHGFVPEAVVLHIAQGSLEGMRSWFATPAWNHIVNGVGVGPAGAHFGVGRDGKRCDIYVSTDNAAIANGWRAGTPLPWVMRENPNALANWLTVAVEFEGFSIAEGGEPPTAEQVKLGVKLVADLFRHVIKPGTEVNRDSVLMHRDFDPVGRPNCPGWGEEFHAGIIAAVRAELAGDGETPEPGPGGDVGASSVPASVRVCWALSVQALSGMAALLDSATPDRVAFVKQQLQETVDKL